MEVDMISKLKSFYDLNLHLLCFDFFWQSIVRHNVGESIMVIVLKGGHG
jgi:hypothetical protein